jgi:NAD(P)-dependent dehydrogenase (short-subunit alcohol dehydrogenase family)
MSGSKQIAIITGGATGIGLATAKALVDRDVHVVLAGRNAERGRAAAAELGERASFVACDVRREAEVAALVAGAVERSGALDLMFNNAGIEGRLGLVTELDEADLDDVIATNLKGVLFGTKHAVRAMLPHARGVVVNTASFVGTRLPLPVAPIYGPIKAAVLSSSKTTAASFAGQGIRAYAVCPYMIDTPMLDRLTSGSAEARAQFATLNPSGSIASPGDVAQVVVDMLFEPTRYPSGAAVFVDHGGAAGTL